MSQLDAQLQVRLPQPGDWQATQLRRAAVLCPIVALDDQDHLLLGLRPMTSNAHAGQIAFPGGKLEGDETPVETALRECHEELGMPPQSVTPLGELSPRVSSSRFFVHCVVGRVPPFELRLAPREVDRALFVPLSALLDQAQWRDLPPPHAQEDGEHPLSPHFRFGEDVIWGLTGRFIRDLVDVIGG